MVTLFDTLINWFHEYFQFCQIENKIEILKKTSDPDELGSHVSKRRTICFLTWFHGKKKFEV